MGGRRGGTELFCLLGGDKSCKRTKLGKNIRVRKSYGDIGEKKETKRSKRECF